MDFRDFAKLYLNNHAIPNKASWKKDLSYINRLMLPHFGRLKLKSIKRIDIVTWFNEITATNGPFTANRAQEVLRKMFNCAIDWELYVGRNPATRIIRNKEQSRTEFVSPDVLPRLLIALTTCDNIYIRGAILFQILSGLRPGEVLSLKHSDIDLASQILTLGKTKNGTAHSLPLSSEILLLLQNLPQKGDWVFPSGKLQNRPLRNIHRPWHKIRVAAGLSSLRLHDLRRTVGSYLALANFSERIIGDVLNHKSPTSTRIYSRLNLSPKRDALEHQAITVRQILNGANLPPLDQILTADELPEQLHHMKKAA